MPEPTLDEITSIPADPARGTGTPAFVIPQKDILNHATSAAQYKAENDWRKYNYFLNNLTSTYKNLQDLSAMEVATPDREYLKKKATSIYEDIAKNPASIYSPELNDKLAELTREGTESKLNRVYDFAHREYINRNPELNTQENQDKIQGYLSQPLGKRSPYVLDLPTVFNFNSYKDNLLSHPLVKTKFAVSDIIGGLDDKGNATKGDEFMRELEGNKYDYKKFINLWDAGLATEKDKYGHSIVGYVDQVLKSLPETQQAYYKKNGGIPKLWHDLGINAFGTDQDVTETTKNNLQPNPNYGKRQEIAQGWARIGLDKRKLDDKDNEDVYNADAVLKEATSIIDKGSSTIVHAEGPITGKKDLFQIADPTLLQTFGKIDKDGRYYDIPDEVQYDKDKGQLYLVYLKKTPDVSKTTKETSGVTTTTHTGGDQVMDRGKRLVDRLVPLDERTWLKHIAKRSFPNKDIGKVNSIVEEVYSKGGANLFQLSAKLKGTEAAPKEEVPALGSYDEPTQNGIKAFADANKLSVEEALKILKEHGKIK